ncbi:MAG: cobalamin B12-binding domain-containing protein [Acidimicrobiales bacterium]
MTVYRYVRTGRLLARYADGRWQIEPAGVAGDPHALPVMMAGDIPRGAGFDVIQMGADVPADSLVAMAVASDLAAIGLSASASRSLDRAASEIRRLHRRAPRVPVLLGGPAVPEPDLAPQAGADGWAADGLAAAEAFGELSHLA